MFMIVAEGNYLPDFFNNKSFAELKKDYKKITDESDMEYLNKYIMLYGNNIRYKIMEKLHLISILHHNTIYNYYSFKNDLIPKSKIVFYNKKYCVFHTIYNNNRIKNISRIIEKKWLYLYKNNKYKLLNKYKGFPYKLLYNDCNTIRYSIKNGYKKHYYNDDRTVVLNTHYFFNIDKKVYHDIWLRYRYSFNNIYIYFSMNRENYYKYKYINNFKYIFLFII